MSYQEKRTIVSTITGILILAAYCFHTYGKYQSGALASADLKSWAMTILVFIGIGIIATIIIQIVFHILLSISLAVSEKIRGNDIGDKEIERAIESEMVTDEMDALIELKSMRIAFVVSGIGFIAGLLSLVFNYSPVVMMNVLFVSFSFGSILEGFTQFYYYRRGIKNV